MKPSLTFLPWLLAGLSLPGIVEADRAIAATAIDTRQPGIVCDNGQQLCWDRNGLDVEATRRSFGRFGEDNARRLIRQGERGRTFQLSNGIACDVNQRTCWDDGWKRRNVSNSLTRHLFAGGSQNWNNEGWNGSSGGGSGFSGQCLLRRGGRTVYQGDCELRERGDGSERRFEATMRNGPRYVFENQRGRTWIRDGSGGSWPVDHRDYGRAAVFRWADMSLEARQNSYRGSGSDRNRTLEDVLRQLFN
jgi:hypothetical protein